MTSPVTDRLAALRGFTAVQLAELLERVPALTDALHGTGPLAPLRFEAGTYGPAPLQPTVPALAQVLGSRPGIYASLTTLDRFHFQLVALAMWHDGTLSRDRALTEIGDEHADAAEAAADHLESLLLADRSRSWLRLRPGVGEVIGLPGLRMRTYLRHALSDQLGRALSLLGAQAPVRKDDRLDALERCLRDPGVLQATLSTAPEDAERIFALLAQHGPQRLTDLGEPTFISYRRAPTPLAWLLDRALVFVDAAEQTAELWLDVRVAGNGGLYNQWEPQPASLRPEPLRAPSPALPPVLSQLDALLALWAGEQPPGLATGGLGVRPIRAAAKRLGLPSGTVGLLAELAVELGLLGTVETAVRGRGRNRTVTYAYAPTQLTQQWSARAPAERWVLLVQAWQQDVQLDESEGLPERVIRDRYDDRLEERRGALIALLEGLPDGTGVPADGLVEAASFRAPVLVGAATARGVVDALRVLGVVPATGPVGLTTLGRAALRGPADVAGALPPPRTEFTVQADHTVIAPPDLAPRLVAQLERYAACESDAGARIYRLEERRIAHALDSGETPDDILAFLRDHSTVDIAQNVEYLVADIARRHGRLRIGTATSYLRSDDPAVLSRAIAVRAAKLRLLAPTVAVSALPRAKLLSTLRDKGLMPVAEDAEGAVLAPARPYGRPMHDGADALPQVRPPREASVVDLATLAKTILDHPDDPVAGGPLLHRRHFGLGQAPA